MPAPTIRSSTRGTAQLSTHRPAQRPTAQRPSTQHSERLPGYTPSKPGPVAVRAATLDLTRNTENPEIKKMQSRKNQRPWTPKEWTFVETIPKNIDSDGLTEYVSKFQDKFKWSPSEGQFRSQHWYFKRSARQMKEFLAFYVKYEQGRSAVKQTVGEMVSRMKTMTLRPR